MLRIIPGLMFIRGVDVQVAHMGCMAGKRLKSPA